MQTVRWMLGEERAENGVSRFYWQRYSFPTKQHGSYWYSPYFQRFRCVVCFVFVSWRVLCCVVIVCALGSRLCPTHAAAGCAKKWAWAKPSRSACCDFLLV